MQIGSRWFATATAALVSGAALAACYAPEFPAGSPCKDSNQCPNGQACVASACALTEGAPIDGSIGTGGDPGSGGTGTTGTGGSGGSGSGTPPGDAGGGTTSCTSTDTCAAAMTLGTVSGDTSSPAVTAQGYRAAWFRIRVTEDDVTLNGSPLRLLATLTPPAGADFDLIVHLNPTQDVLECTAAFGTASTSGTTKQVRASWGNNGFDDGNDDSRDAAIEIRPHATTCDPNAHWQLTLAGDTN